MYTIILRRRRRCWAHCWRHRGPTNGVMGCGGVPRYRRARGVCWVVLDLSDKDYCTNVRLMIVCRRSMRGFDIIEIKMNIRTILLSITCILSRKLFAQPMFTCIHGGIVCAQFMYYRISLVHQSPNSIICAKKNYAAARNKTHTASWVG